MSSGPRNAITCVSCFHAPQTSSDSQACSPGLSRAVGTGKAIRSLKNKTEMQAPPPQSGGLMWVSLCRWTIFHGRVPIFDSQRGLRPQQVSKPWTRSRELLGTSGPFPGSLRWSPEAVREHVLRRRSNTCVSGKCSSLVTIREANSHHRLLLSGGCSWSHTHSRHPALDTSVSLIISALVRKAGDSVYRGACWGAGVPTDVHLSDVRTPQNQLSFPKPSSSTAMECQPECHLWGLAS